MSRLPVIPEQELFIHSIEQKTIKTKTKVLGARHGEFIIVEDPVFRLNERLSAAVKGDFLCWFLHEGTIYRFQSQILKSLSEGITLLSYPPRFFVKRLRRHHRVQLSVPVHFSHNHGRETLLATLTDISTGGCRVIIPALLVLARNMICELDFKLPDNQSVDKIQTKVCDVKYQRLRKSTEVGLQFVGPPEQQARINSFCDYCLRFKV